MKQSLLNILIVLFFVSSTNLKKMNLRQDYDKDYNYEIDQLQNYDKDYKYEIDQLLNAGLSGGAILDLSGIIYKAKSTNLNPLEAQDIASSKYLFLF